MVKHEGKFYEESEKLRIKDAATKGGSWRNRRLCFLTFLTCQMTCIFANSKKHPATIQRVDNKVHQLEVHTIAWTQEQGTHYLHMISVWPHIIQSSDTCAQQVVFKKEDQDAYKNERHLARSLSCKSELERATSQRPKTISETPY